jgi:hypothetical protein
VFIIDVVWWTWFQNTLYFALFDPEDLIHTILYFVCLIPGSNLDTARFVSHWIVVGRHMHFHLSDFQQMSSIVHSVQHK